MKTLNNFRDDNIFEEITIGQVTICTPSDAVYKLTLPIDTGLAGQVLTTDGNGVTSWTVGSGGTVTSVGYTATGLTGFTASGGPITGSGTLNLSYSGAPIPVANGGTGAISATGTGSVVLGTAPTISGLTTTDGANIPLITGDGVETYVCQFQDDTAITEDSSIAITAGEDDQATVFFGTNNGNSLTGAHKVAIISAGQNSFSRADLHLCVNNDGDNTTSASLADSKLKIDYTNGVVTIDSALITNNNGKEFTYDEGTWTPEYQLISGGTAGDPSATINYDLQAGTWIRVGKKVTVYFHLQFDIDSDGDKFSSGIKFVCISGLPFKCNAFQEGSHFANRNQMVVDVYPDGIIGSVNPVTEDPFYDGPYESYVIANGAIVPLLMNIGTLQSHGTWTSDGFHILVFAKNDYLPAPAGTRKRLSNQCLSNRWLEDAATYSNQGFKGSIEYFTDDLVPNPG